MVHIRLSSRCKRILMGVGAAAAVMIIIVVLAVTNIGSTIDESKPYQDLMGHAAISSNGVECAKIGRDILMQHGSAADAAIAVLLCEGVSCAQSMGLGGGFVMTIYTKETRLAETLNARERAPLAATEEMFVNNPENAAKGGRSVAVPGELQGYWELHQKYGRLNWSDLFQPTIKLCENGYTVSAYLARVLKIEKEHILADRTLSEMYTNPVTGNIYEEGETATNPKLAETLRVIATEGYRAIYNGTLTKSFIADIQQMGGIITEEDLLSYRVKWEKPVQTTVVDNFTLFSTPLPSSGGILVLILNILKDYLESKPSVLNYHRITEAFKYAYAKRTELGDMDFEPEVQELFANLTNPKYAAELRALIDDQQTYTSYDHYGANFSNFNDHGTVHVSIVAPNGDAIAITSTINEYFGSKTASASTGIILNNEMDDFGTPGNVNGYGIPPSPMNFIKPQKQPMSSMTPVIIVNSHGDVDTVIGCAGGSKITTVVAYVIVRHFIFLERLADAVAAPRIHHQLAPMVLNYEAGFDAQILKGLEALNHTLEQLPYDSGFAALTAIAREGNKYSSVFDSRRGGSSEVFTIDN